MFSTDTYISRRTHLATTINKGIILLLGNDESPMNYPDNTYHYRQDSSFLYYTGIKHPGLALIIDTETNEVTLFGDDYTIDDIVWMGVQPTIKARALTSGIKNTAPVTALATAVRQAAAKGRQIHYLPPYRARNREKLSALLETSVHEIPQGASLELVKAVVNQRNYKSAEEIVEIEKAVNTTVEMHQATMRLARPGMNEAQIAAEVTRVAQAAGGQLSFPVIATINGQTLHNHYHGNTLEEGKLFLLDAGAETAMGYAGDMSSTFPVGKTFTPEQKIFYNIALAAHNKAISMLAPGIPFRDVHLEACRTIAQGMKDEGFLKGNVDDMVQQGVHAMFFPCGLGHMMGLDVHDMEDLGEVYVGYDGEPKSTMFGLKSLRLGRKLEPGFVLPIEPGIYFIPDLMKKWHDEKRFMEFINYDKLFQYKDFGGMRNEEDFLITENGARLLGKPLAKSVEDVEEERRKAFE